MIMMPYGWTLDIAAAHRSGRLLAPHRSFSRRSPFGALRALGGRLRRRSSRQMVTGTIAVAMVAAAVIAEAFSQCSCIHRRRWTVTR